jgi:hypothetical protein
MNDLQRQEAARTLQAMVNWSFAETVPSDYRGFIPNPKLSSSLGAEFYFGISFLVAAEFFAIKPWYGTLERPAPPREVCLGMTAYGAALGEPIVVGAMQKLKDACKPYPS